MLRTISLLPKVVALVFGIVTTAMAILFRNLQPEFAFVSIILGVACLAYTFVNAMCCRADVIDQEHLVYVEKQESLRINDYYQGVRQKRLYDQLENKKSTNGKVFREVNKPLLLNEVVVDSDPESAQSESSLVSHSTSDSELDSDSNSISG